MVSALRCHGFLSLKCFPVVAATQIDTVPGARVTSLSDCDVFLVLSVFMCSESKNSPLRFCGNFSKTVGNFSTKFYMPLCVPIYARLQILIQLSPTLTKLCHIKCDHPACVSVDGGHFEHIMVVALNRPVA